MTDKDRQEAALIYRKRAQEEERKKRLFNPRQRIFGIDQEALQKQVEERKQREAEERRVQSIFEAEQRRNDQVCLAMEVKEREERRKINKEINTFRQNYQKPEDRREYDLNDPNFLKKQLPARYRDDDPRCGISSAQKFEGEDLCSEERAKVQREQIKSWLDQQMEEREAAEKERKDAEDAYKAAVIARDQRAVELDAMEKECRKRLELACNRYNKALADEREAYNRERKRQELDDNSAEIYNMMTSDMMTENPDVAQSNLGSTRQIGYMYKGMSPEQKRSIREAQLAQIAEAQARKKNEERVEREFQDYLNGTQRTVAYMDKELARKKKEENKRLAEENKKMGIEQKNHQEYLKRIVYTNKPTAAYYEQFNKSAR